MSSKLITLITGANAGLGYETAKILLRLPEYHVIIGSRDLSKGEKAAESLKAGPDTKGSVEAIQVDVTDDASVNAAAAKVDALHGRLDILVNNAAVQGVTSFAGLNPGAPSARDMYRKVLETNTVGPVSLTEAMLPLLSKAPVPRIVFVSSSSGSLTLAADPHHAFHRAGQPEYRSSKTALNLMMVFYDIALRSKGFKIMCADPGLNATNLSGDPESLKQRGAADPSVGGERIAKCIRGERDEYLGRVCGEYGDEVTCPW